MNSQLSNQLTEVRAKALLTISLTSRDDLLISELDDDFGYDFLVRIIKDGFPSSRMFGIELKATARVTDEYDISLDRQNVSRYKDIPFPVCLFFYYMSDDKGYYKWLVEPFISFDGKSELRLALKDNESSMRHIRIAKQELTELNRDTLEKLVNTVNSWYDAR